MTTKEDPKELKMWRGEFGDEYTDRNMPNEQNINQRMQFWAGVFSALPVTPQSDPKIIMEVGANVGANIVAIDKLYEQHGKFIDLYALEPNDKARQLLKRQDIRSLRVVNGIAQEIGLETASVDIVFTCGMLIHLSPDQLQKALFEIYRVSKKFIICAEYFSPQLREIKYRDNDSLLWANDYGSLFLDGFRGLRCCGYSFAWKRLTGMDNLTWWVFEKCH